MHPLDLLTSWTESLLAEREAERHRFKGLQENVSLKLRRAEGMTWSPVEVTAAAYAYGGAKWHLKCKEGAGLPGAFRVGSAISLKPVGSESETEAIGVWPARVMKVRGMELEVVLEGDGPEGIAVQHITWTVDARADERSFNAMAHALSHWVNVEDADRKRFRDLALGLTEWPASSDTKRTNSQDVKGLNAQQMRAVQSMCSEAPIALLHGPPGRGKPEPWWPA